MPSPIVAVVAGGVATSALSSAAQSKAAEGAAGAQLEASRLGIEEQRRQFDRVQELLSPFTEAGTQAVERQGAIAGLQGPEAQREAIANIESSPLFTSIAEQGENALLQNAAATGGLRGGDIQGALAQFRPALLNQFLNQEFNRLGGLANLGQASAAGVASAGVRTGENVTNLITEGGQVRARNILDQGEIRAQQFGDIGTLIGTAARGEF